MCVKGQNKVWFARDFSSNPSLMEKHFATNLITHVESLIKGPLVSNKTSVVHRLRVQEFMASRFLRCCYQTESNSVLPLEK
jgi:hypothetical protein